MNPIRSLVSKKKRRFTESGFDLDLSYITDRIIAMGYPSEGVEALFRNPMKEVLKFLEALHKNHYRVYNLCSERRYKPEKFHFRVAEFPFDDHNAPPFQMLRLFCEDVKKWLDQNPSNVIVVHCKAGKGRTGTMIACYLLYSKVCQSANEAITLFGTKRCHDGKGVTVPSQRRYVHYFAHFLRLGQTTPRPQDVLFLKKIEIFGLSPKGHKGIEKYDPWIAICQRGRTACYAKDYAITDEGRTAIFLTGNLFVSGDVKIEFYNGNSKSLMFWFWLNTEFIPESDVVILTKDEIDKAAKDTKHTLYAPNMRITLYFRAVGRFKTKLNLRPNNLSEENQNLSQQPRSQSQQQQQQAQSQQQQVQIQQARLQSPPPPLQQQQQQQQQQQAQSPPQQPQQQEQFQSVFSSSPRSASSLRDLKSLIPNTEMNGRDMFTDNGILSNPEIVFKDPESQQALTCGYCHKLFGKYENSINVGGKNYHWNCLRCSVCEEPMINRFEAVIDKDTTLDKLVCSKCDNKFCTTCSLCGKILMNDEFTEDVKELGPICQNCFRCAICGEYYQRSDDDEYEEEENKWEVIGKKLVCKHHSEARVKEIVAQEQKRLQDQSPPQEQQPTQNSSSPPSTSPSSSPPSNTFDSTIQFSNSPTQVRKGFIPDLKLTPKSSKMKIGMQRQSRMLSTNNIDSNGLSNNTNNTNNTNNNNALPSISSSSQNATSSRTCHRCNTPICPGEYYMIASNYNFHKHCFFCKVCKKEIHAGEKFYFDKTANEFLCEYDYNDLMLPKCVTCGGPIVGEYKVYKEKPYHTNHLVCTNCKEVLPDMFYEIDRMPWCGNCYHSRKNAVTKF